MFDPSWKKRIPLTVNINQIPSTQTDFPLLINSIFPDLIGASVNELRFAGIDNVQLEYEIEIFDSITGELTAWVRKPTISDGDIIYIYFDNDTAVDEQDKNAVWNNDYKVVYHMNGNNDSTSNAQNLITGDVIIIPSKIGNGTLYPGSFTGISIRNTLTVFPSSKVTVELWIQTTETTPGGIFVYSKQSPNNEFVIDNPDDLLVFINDSLTNTNVVINDGIFHHIVVSWRSSDGKLDVYIDGILIHSAIVSTGILLDNNGILIFGLNQLTSETFAGLLDEIRISDKFIDQDYISTTYNNQNNPNTFYTIGVVENTSLTKTVTTDLCVNTGTKANLCANTSVKAELCV